MHKLLLAVCLSAIPAMAADMYTFTVPAGENASGLDAHWLGLLHPKREQLFVAGDHRTFFRQRFLTPGPSYYSIFRT
jgi:hypothetical protein